MTSRGARLASVGALVLIAVSVAVFVATNDDSNPARSTVYRGTVTVIQESRSAAAQACVIVFDSRPPQCGGTQIVGWDWAAVQGEESAAGTTWGSFEVDVTWDGSALTLVDARSPGTSPRSTESKTPGTECPEPPGGWRAHDETRLSVTDNEALTTYVGSQPDLSAVWRDNSHDPNFDPEHLENYDADWTRIVMNARFVADASRHEQEMRALWGGPICVTEGGRSRTEMREIKDEVIAQLKPQSGAVREVEGWIEIGVLIADPAVKADLDRRYGAGTVVLSAALVPVPAPPET